MTEPLSPERISEIKSLLRYETSISFHSARAKESMLLLVAEVERLRAELIAATEDAAFMHRITIPDLRRNVTHHEDGKKRWRDRAEKAEAERDRFRLAWKSARERAVAYGEGILRAVGDRESYQSWLKEAEGRLEVQRRQSNAMQSAANIADHALSANAYSCEADARRGMKIATAIKAALRGGW